MDHPLDIADDLEKQAEDIADTGEECLTGILKASNLQELQAELAKFFHKNSDDLEALATKMAEAVKVGEERVWQRVEEIYQELSNLRAEMQSNSEKKETPEETKGEAEEVPEEKPEKEKETPEEKPKPKRAIY